MCIYGSGIESMVKWCARLKAKCLEDSKLWNRMTASVLKQAVLEEVVTNQPKQDKSFALIFSFWPFICCLSVVLWLDKADFPESVHTACPG